MPLWKGDTWNLRLILEVMNSLFWLRLGLWKKVLTWSVCMLWLGKTLKCKNIKRRLFLFYGCSVIRGSNWDPHKFVKHTNSTFLHGWVILKAQLHWEFTMRGKETTIFISNSSFLFCVGGTSKHPPAVSLSVWLRPISRWLGGISVWALRLLCAVHL